MNDTTTGPDRSGLFDIASQQAGYFTTKQAQGLGFSSPLITYHTNRGAFARVARGLYRLRDYPSSVREAVIAAWLKIGPNAAVSHESALEVFGLADLIPDAVHITVPRERRRAPQMPGVRVHTTTKPLAGDQTQIREGMRVTAPARTIVDVAETGSAPEQISAAIRQALQRGLMTPEQLHNAAYKASQRVVGLIEGAIPGPAEARYASPGAFRRALEARLNTISREEGRSVARMRKEVAFDRLLARLLLVAGEKWVLKGGLALDYRFGNRARTTKDIDIAMDGGERDATRDLLAAQAVDVADYFAFTIERTEGLDDMDGDVAVRYHVKAELAGRTFEEFGLDVGFDPPQTIDEVHGTDLLAFAGIPRVIAPAITLESHIAEKVHAYTKAYGVGGRPSTRVKDLVDLYLIAEQAELHGGRLRRALDDTFSRRGTHELPVSFPSPPATWRVPYSKLAKEVGVPGNLDLGYRRASKLLNPILQAREFVGIWHPASVEWSSPT